MNLDRFSQGLPDLQDAKVVAHCDNCGGEIYAGQAFLEYRKTETFCGFNCAANGDET